MLDTVTGGARTPERVEQGLLAELVQPLPLLDGCGDQDHRDLPEYVRACLDRRVAGQVKDPDRLDGAVTALGGRQRFAGHNDACSSDRIERVGLAVEATRGTVRTDHLTNLDPGGDRVTGQAGTVGVRALDTEPDHRPEIADEREDRAIPGQGRWELPVAQQRSGPGIEHGQVMGLRVCVCPGDNETLACHDG